MVIVYHDDIEIVGLAGECHDSEFAASLNSIIEGLYYLAEQKPNTILVWCHISQKDHLNLEFLNKEFTQKNMMISYASNSYFSESIGYVEDSPFIKVNKKVKYPTWLMSSLTGAIYALTLLEFKEVLNPKDDFNYQLNSIAKLGMSKGLMCYSSPSILKLPEGCIEHPAGFLKLFKFVKQHYKTQWVFLLLFNLFVYEKKLPIVSFLKSLFSKKVELNTSFITENIGANFSKVKSPLTIDVIIPTIGRKKYLYDVLKDLSKQSLLPSQVIIIEQNPDFGSSSELDYLQQESWPFEIIHEFTNKTGACKARNFALSKVTASHVFLADDDIRITPNVLKDTLSRMEQYGWQVSTLSCLQKNEVESCKQYKQWSSFGSGCSILEAQAASGVAFDLALEHGFGEDTDFGAQLRNSGVDVIYLFDVNILHLKAPVGGFRTKFELPWKDEVIQPKPSPTIMYNRLKNTSKQQVLGYKTVLFFKYYKVQKIKNPWHYINHFKKQWNKSMYWANKF